MKHSSWHLLGCLLPIAAIFLLPLFGVSSGVLLFVFIVLMFGCHLLMMGGHGHGGGSHPDNSGEQRHAHE